MCHFGSIVRRVIAAAIAVGAIAGPSQAGLITAAEPNNTFATAQNINGNFTSDFNTNIGTGAGAGFTNTSTTIPHVTILRNNTTGGLDFFRFTVTTNGLVILDIDSSATNPNGGGTPPEVTNFDTELFLFDAAGTGLINVDDNGGDPGDTTNGSLVGNLYNSRIETLLAAGDYVVGVAQFSSGFGSSPGTINGSQIPEGGSYTLHVSANANVNPVTAPAPAGAVLLGIGTGCLGLFRTVRRKAAARA